MNRIRLWFVNKYLPAVAKQSLLEDNERLIRRISSLESELKTERAYSAGLELGLKTRRITINNEVK